MFAGGPDGSNTYIGAIAYDSATGSVLWTAGYSGPGSNAQVAMGINPDGTSVFMTGTTGYGPPNYGDYTTFSFAASDGAMQWMDTWDGGGDGAHRNSPEVLIEIPHP